jgi:hypothetical protein
MPNRQKSRPTGEPTRRGFIKGVAAGAVAAASLAAGAPAGSAPLAEAAPKAGATAAGGRHLRVSFDTHGKTTLEDVQAAVKEALGVSGCTRCGFDGIDLRLLTEEIVTAGPEPTPWVTTSWEPSGF